MDKHPSRVELSDFFTLRSPALAGRLSTVFLITGFIKTLKCALGSDLMTKRDNSTPTCGAASPTPSGSFCAARVDFIFLTRARILASIFLMGLVEVLSILLGVFTIGTIMRLL